MIKKLDNWCDELWIYFMCLVGGLSIGLLIANWNTWDAGVKAGLFGAIIMPFHVIEEWKLPGGLHHIYNVMFASRKYGNKYLNRFPMSRFTDMLTNIFLCLIPLVYALLAANHGLSADVSICMILFGFMELFAHTAVGIYSFVRYRSAGKRTIYDPGFGTSILMFLPASVYLIRNLPATTASNWLVGILLMVIMAVISVPLAEFPFRNWVRDRKDGAFVFENAKYYQKFVDRGRW